MPSPTDMEGLIMDTITTDHTVNNTNNANAVIDDIVRQSITQVDNESKNNNNEGNPAAVQESAEDTARGYESVIAEQSKQIDALMAHNERLYKQLEKMLENGAAITDGAKEEKQVTESEYTPLKDLGGYFGTKDIYKE